LREGVKSGGQCGDGLLWITAEAPAMKQCFLDILEGSQVKLGLKWSLRQIGLRAAL
jgi:hypothetical protein